MMRLTPKNSVAMNFKYLHLWLSNVRDQIFFCSLKSVSETLCTLDLMQLCSWFHFKWAFSGKWDTFTSLYEKSDPYFSVIKIKHL